MKATGYVKIPLELTLTICSPITASRPIARDLPNQELPQTAVEVSATGVAQLVVLR